jgi:hypothetical protein
MAEKSPKKPKCGQKTCGIKYLDAESQGNYKENRATIVEYDARITALSIKNRRFQRILSRILSLNSLTDAFFD